MLVLTAFGSSMCPPVANSADVADSHTIVVRFDPPGEQACTDDFGPSRSRISAPSGDIDLDSEVFAYFDLEGAPLQLIPVQLVHPVVS